MLGRQQTSEREEYTQEGGGAGAAGNDGRDYSRSLRDHDLACLGPSDPGGYAAALVNEGRLSRHKAGAIRRFKESVSPGDPLLLRRGHKVVAIGVFADEPYCWRPSLDDIRGWNLQHSRRVSWQKHLHQELEALPGESVRGSQANP